jgi:hypothetical protein
MQEYYDLIGSANTIYAKASELQRIGIYSESLDAASDIEGKVASLRKNFFADKSAWPAHLKFNATELTDMRTHGLVFKANSLFNKLCAMEPGDKQRNRDGMIRKIEQTLLKAGGFGEGVEFSATMWRAMGGGAIRPSAATSFKPALRRLQPDFMA